MWRNGVQRWEVLAWILCCHQEWIQNWNPGVPVARLEFSQQGGKASSLNPNKPIFLTSLLKQNKTQKVTSFYPSGTQHPEMLAAEWQLTLFSVKENETQTY